MNQPVNVGQKTLNDLLVWIAQRGENIQSAQKQFQKIQEKTAIYYRKMDSRELEALLAAGAPGTMSTSEKNAFIYLPPTEKGPCIVPILSVEYNYATEPPEATLRIALFLLDSKDDIKAIGYRFETASRQGRHRYCHIQHIDGLGQNKFPPGVEWIPTEYPAFPLDAQDPIELVICMLVSLYDREILDALEGKFKTFIKSNIEKMRLYRFTTQL